MRHHSAHHHVKKIQSKIASPLFIEELGLTSGAESDMAETEAALSRAGLVVMFESVAYPNFYLRLDATGLTSGPGGVVKCQLGAADKKNYFIVRAAYPNVFNIESLQFPDVFLRLDGRGPSKNGTSGLVNANNGPAGSYESFVLRQETAGQYSVMSAQFPNVYLRMDCFRGVVNAQVGVGPTEKFRIRFL
ncbi:hypothetical protein EMCRGX_G010203 [Ephydatia muelleri]